MDKSKLVITIALVLVIIVVTSVATSTFDNSHPSRSYIIWTDLAYAGSTPLGWENTTISNSYYTDIQATYKTVYNYTFSVNTNTLTLMSIHDHCATIIPGWNDGIMSFTYTKTNATSWDFNVGYNETGPSIVTDTKTGQIITQSGPSTQPLTQAQIDTINADFRSQNT
jgi:hypothetical protein